MKPTVKSNSTKYAILGVLSRGPATGYEIKSFCDGSIAHFWNENYGHIYPVLKSLEREGCATMEPRSEPGRPASKVYAITEQGRRELEAWLLGPTESQSIRLEFLLKFVFSGGLPRERIAESLGRQRAAAIADLGALERQEALLRDRAGDGAEAFRRELWLGSLEFGKRRAAMIRQWCDDMIAALEEECHERQRDDR